MLWPSETDRPIYPVSLGKAPSSRQSLEKAVRDEPASAPVEVCDFDGAFQQLTEVDDPNDPDDVARVQKFSALRDTLKANLTDLHLVRVGANDIDVYAVGKDSKGQWVGVMSGVMSGVVET